MLIINEILGNINTAKEWKKLNDEMSRNGQVHTITFSRLESERCRLFKRSQEFNEEMGINLKRGTVLHDGDVLYYKAGEKMFVAKIEAEEMMVLNFVGKVSEEAMFEAAVRLGHAIGNQHWQIKVVGKTVFIPLTIDRKVMESVIKTHNIPGVEYIFKEVDSEQITNKEYNPLHSTPQSHNHYLH
ncbi:MAG TPA: hypothetical protein VI489_01980 [Candidatus Brocadiaceae bacterium]